MPSQHGPSWNHVGAGTAYSKQQLLPGASGRASLWLLSLARTRESNPAAGPGTGKVCSRKITNVHAHWKVEMLKQINPTAMT